MNDIIQHSIQELQHAITVSKLNYEIWWVYKEKESRKRYTDTLNTYPAFFKISLHAHFVAMVISLYRLYETRKDTINLPQLMKLIKDAGLISQHELKSIETDINKIKPLWEKVSVLRNNLFGHRSKSLEFSDVWKQAQVTSNQFKQLIDESKVILNKVTALQNRSTHLFNLSSTKDILKLLEDLKRLNEKKP
jgi:AbiU2